MLLAKLKSNYKYPRAVLFSGREFVKIEWRPVPDEFEAQARQDERVEVKEVKKDPAVQKAIEDADAVETTPDEKGSRRHTRKKSVEDDVVIEETTEEA